MGSFDEDRGERGEYECLNAGCRGDRYFEAAPEWWFEERGLDYPANCDDCREWIGEQKAMGPIAARCRHCGYTWPIEAAFRIMFHRNEGNWDDHWEKSRTVQMCHRCSEVPTRRRHLARRFVEKKCRDPEKRRRLREKLRKQDADEEGLVASVLGQTAGACTRSYEVPANAMYYHSLRTHPSEAARHGATQLEHIMKATHRWSSKLGTNDSGTILRLAAGAAKSTSERVRQYVDTRTSKVIKYDAGQRLVVIIAGDSASPTGNRIETAYPVKASYVLDKLDQGRWR